MRTFEIKNPADWTHVLAGEVLEMANPAGVRRARLSINTTEKVAVFMANNPDMKDPILVGASDGMFDVVFTAKGMAYVQIKSPKGAIVFVKHHTRDQLHKQVNTERFTNVEQFRRRATEQDRMVHLIKLNEQKRDKMLAKDRAELRAEIARLKEVQKPPEVVERDPAPQPDQAPEPDPAEGGGEE